MDGMDGFISRYDYELCLTEFKFTHFNLYWDNKIIVFRTTIVNGHYMYDSSIGFYVDSLFQIDGGFSIQERL